MKKFLLLLLLLLISSALTSCHTTHYIPMPSSHARDSVHSDLHFFVKNTIQHDSIYIHERSDTVFVERWSIRYRDRIVAHTDTVCVVRRDSIPYPVEVQSPPRRKPLLPFHREDAPRFYRTCTLGFFLILLCIILYVFLRLYFHR